MRPALLLLLCYAGGICCCLYFKPTVKADRLQQMARLRPALMAITKSLPEHASLGLITIPAGDEELLVEARWILAPRNVEKAMSDYFRGKDTLLVISARGADDPVMQQLLSKHTLLANADYIHPGYYLLKVNSTRK